MRFLSKLLLTLCVLVEFGQSLLSSLNIENDVLFILNSRKAKFNREEIFTVSTQYRLKGSAFDPSKPTVYLVHGFMENRKIKHYAVLSKDLLNRSDVNVFLVDWGKGAYDIDYSAARAKVNDVAAAVGTFHNYLQERFGLNSSTTTCIGFSLGAHACGLVHQYLTSGKFGKVIGLDPANLQFDINDSTTRISPESATYVECIHTSYFPVGIRAPVCQADFFVNRATQQPGCQSLFRINNLACSHTSAVKYFSEALRNPEAFFGQACDSLESALDGYCFSQFGAFMGHEGNARKQLRGMFSVMTIFRSFYGR